MKGMKQSLLEENGYYRIDKIDLVDNKKEAVIVNVLSIAILVVMVSAIPFLFHERVFGGNMVRVTIFALSIILMIPIHELIHGAVVKCYSDEKLSFGWKLVYAYCGSKEAVLKIKEYFLVALAPLVVFSLFFVSMIFINPVNSTIWYTLEAFNVSSCAGDIYVTIKLWKKRNADILISDTGTDMTVWGK